MNPYKQCNIEAYTKKSKILAVYIRDKNMSHVFDCCIERDFQTLYRTYWHYYGAVHTIRLHYTRQQLLNTKVSFACRKFNIK